MQLDLFSQKRKAVVFAFPTSRRADLIRQAAAIIAGKSYQQGKSYWTSHVRGLRRELTAIGLSATAIDAEINSYTNAVSQELNISRHYRGQPDGAA